jgi:hypothetical protein
VIQQPDQFDTTQIWKLLALQGAQLWNHGDLAPREIPEDGDMWSKAQHAPPVPARTPKPEFQIRKPETRILKTESRILKPEIRNSKPEAIPCEMWSKAQHAPPVPPSLYLSLSQHLEP